MMVRALLLLPLALLALPARAEEAPFYPDKRDLLVMKLADQIGVTFPLLSDWGGEVTHKYGIYTDKYKAARRVNFLIGKDGTILEEQIDSEAIDPTKLVAACERHKLAIRPYFPLASGMLTGK